MEFGVGMLGFAIIAHIKLVAPGAIPCKSLSLPDSSFVQSESTSPLSKREPQGPRESFYHTNIEPFSKVPNKPKAKNGNEIEIAGASKNNLTLEEYEKLKSKKEAARTALENKYVAALHEWKKLEAESQRLFDIIYDDKKTPGEQERAEEQMDAMNTAYKALDRKYGVKVDSVIEALADIEADLEQLAKMV